MADEFQGGVCGGNWWSTSSRNMFGSSLCSSGAINDMGGGFGWSDDLFDMKARSSDESASASDGSVVLQDVPKPHKPASADGTGKISMDSTLQMMNTGLSCSTTTSDWNQALFQNNGSSESNYSSMLEQDLNSGMNYGQESGIDCPQIQKQWSPKNYTSVSEDSSTNTFEQVNQNFALNQQHLCTITSSGDYTATCQGLPTSFSVNSSSSFGYPLLQTLIDSNPHHHKPLYSNQSMNFPSTTSYFTSSDGFSPSLYKLSPMLKASLSKQHVAISDQLPFSKNTSSWNSSAAALNDIRAASLLASTQLQMPSSTPSEKINLRNLTAKPNNEEVAKKTNDEPAFKRPRIETPSPLPTFKVRKEKLGDRITALQQLVSPFGKTDTASVLHEAIEYIKFLHDQVSVLSTPYLKNGSPGQRQQVADRISDQEGAKQDLRSRGLCLVPISSTFPVAAETTTDFWTPTFGGPLR